MENLDIHKNESDYILQKETSWFSKKCSIKDKQGKFVAVLEQKKLLFSKIKTDVFVDNNQEHKIATIIPKGFIDLNHHFNIKNKEGELLGKLEKKFITSKLWRTRYEFFNTEGKLKFVIIEENPWLRISNSLLKKSKRTSLIPRFFFKPAYQILDENEHLIADLTERKGLFKSSRTLRIESIPKELNENLILVAAMILLYIE